MDGITQMTGYVYDAEGRRVAKGSITTWSCDPSTNGLTASDSETDYVLNQSGQQVTEMAMDSNGNMNWEHSNVWADGQLIATYSAITDANGQPDGALHFYLNDWLGTRRVQTDYAGVVEQTCTSLPYGDAESCAPTPTEQLFTGKERDSESGNDYFGARYYASTTGRFLSPDWSSTPDAVPFADLTNPQSLNLYQYAGNNPLIHVDSNGHCWGWIQSVCNFFQRPIDWVGGWGFVTFKQVRAIKREYVASQVTGPGDKDWVMNTATTSQINAAYAYFHDPSDQSNIDALAKVGIQIASSVPMLGANGTQVTSKTLWEDGNEHIDVENPNPGQRPGQIHYQDAANNKYIYNVGTGEFEGLSKTQSEQLMSKPEVQQAIQKGLRYLGVNQ